MTHQDDAEAEYVTFTIAGRTFGALVDHVHDVFRPQAMTPVPMSRADVAGLLNLRGRIVTAIDARTRLGLPQPEATVRGMAIGVERAGEPYALLVDAVGEVVRLKNADREEPPTSLDPAWLELALGVFRRPEGLMLIVDVRRMLEPPGGFGMAAA